MPRAIAVIEDEQTIAAAVAARLRAEGFLVEIAADGPSGVALVEQRAPDLVVLDLMLPGFDGIEACRRIQATRPVPVVMLRLVVGASVAVIAVVLVLLLVAGARWRAGWLPRGVLVSAVVALLALNVLNADGFIAGRNIDRAGKGAALDMYYLSGLSADAVPQLLRLLRLPEPDRTCVLETLRYRLEQDGGGWRGANVARSRARSLLPAPTASCGTQRN